MSSSRLLTLVAVTVSAMSFAAPASAGCMSCGCEPRGLLQTMAVAPPPCGYAGGPVYVVNQGPAFGEPVPYLYHPAVRRYPYGDFYGQYGHRPHWHGHWHHWRPYYRAHRPHYHGHHVHHPRRPYAHRHGPMVHRHAMPGHHRMMGHRTLYRGRPAYHRAHRHYRTGPYGARWFIGYRAGMRAGYGPRYQRPVYRRGGLTAKPVPVARPAARLHSHDVNKGP